MSEAPSESAVEREVAAVLLEELPEADLPPVRGDGGRPGARGPPRALAARETLAMCPPIAGG